MSDICGVGFVKFCIAFVCLDGKTCGGGVIIFSSPIPLCTPPAGGTVEKTGKQPEGCPLRVVIVMPDYQEMYCTMVRATEEAMNVLIKAQRDCEELYINSSEPESSGTDQ